MTLNSTPISQIEFRNEKQTKTASSSEADDFFEAVWYGEDLFLLEVVVILAKVLVYCPEFRGVNWTKKNSEEFSNRKICLNLSELLVNFIH